MSSISSGTIGSGGGGGMGTVKTLTGNTGGAVSPDGSGNINTIVDADQGTVTIVGNAVANTTQIQFTDGLNNTSIGKFSFLSNVSGVSNTVYGVASLGNLLTGNYNLILGSQTGQQYTGSESSNILLMNDGVTGENNVMRLGTQGSGSGQQATCYIAGIYANSPSSPEMVIINSDGELGSQAISSTGITTIDGNTGSITGTTVTIETANSTVIFANSGTVSTEDFGISNLLLGSDGSAISGAVDNVGVGLDALTAIISGEDNTAVGVSALQDLTSGNRNTAAGWSALSTITTGTDNVAVGYEALIASTTSASGNTAVGSSALATSTTAQNNTAVGYNALNAANGGSNTAIGGGSQVLLTSGSLNTSVGGGSLSASLTGVQNVAVGYAAGAAYVGAESNNICIGYNTQGAALESNVTRIGNNGTVEVFITGIDGVDVGPSSVNVVTEYSNQLGTAVITAGSGISVTGGTNTITIAATGGGSGITTIDGDTGSVTGSTVKIYANATSNINGYSVNFSNSGTTSTLNLVDSSGSIYLGPSAGVATVTSGLNNIALGYQAYSSADLGGGSNIAIGISSMSGSGCNRDIAIGDSTMSGITQSGGDNIAIGTSAMTVGAGFEGGRYIAIGREALASGTADTGAENIAIGYQAGYNGFGSSEFNIALGSQAGPASINPGSYNILIGQSAGGSYGTGGEAGNILLGAANTPVSGESNVCRIGDGPIGAGNPNSLAATYISGIQAVVVTGNAVLVSTADQLGVAASSRRFKNNINDMSETSSDIHKLRPVTFVWNQSSSPGLKNATQDLQYGLIAEEVAQTMPQLVEFDKTGQPFTVKYSDLVPMLLNEHQKALKRIEALEAQLKPMVKS